MWNWNKSWKAIRAIRPYARPYRGWLAQGAAATVAIVLLRLAMPWPLRGLIEITFPKGPGRARTWALPLPEGWNQELVLIGIFLLIALGVGVAEMIQRICMAKFATHTVHDMRAAAVHGAGRRGSRGGGTAVGDLIARIIGDTARIKANLKGFLVHFSQNGFLYLGVAAILLFLAPSLGLCFLAGALLTIWISVRTAAVVARTARKQRRKEGAYAVAIHQALEHGGLQPSGEAINRSSASKDVALTRIISWSSLLVHGALAVTVGLGLWIGIRDVRAGTLTSGHLFLFIAYVLTVHRRLIQVGRQMALSGKVLACVNRVGELLEEGADAPVLRESAPLASGLRLDRVQMDSARGGAPRLRELTLTFRPGSRTAVLGGPGDGKSSLLRLLAGAELPDTGTIFWDDQPVSASDTTLMSRVGHLPQVPVFPRMRVWQRLGLPGPNALTPEQQELLEKIGAWKVIRRLPDGLESKAGSPELSPNEARALVLGAVLLGGASVWALDTPLEGLGRGKSQRRLEAILSQAGGRTLIVSGLHAPDWERFDRVLLMRRGHCEFDGTPAAYRERAAAPPSTPPPES